MVVLHVSVIPMRLSRARRTFTQHVTALQLRHNFLGDRVFVVQVLVVVQALPVLESNQAARQQILLGLPMHLLLLQHVKYKLKHFILKIYLF